MSAAVGHPEAVDAQTRVLQRAGHAGAVAPGHGRHAQQQGARRAGAGLHGLAEAIEGIHAQLDRVAAISEPHADGARTHDPDSRTPITAPATSSGPRSSVSIRWLACS